MLFAAFVLLCLFSIAAVYMANKVEYINNYNTRCLFNEEKRDKFLSRYRIENRRCKCYSNYFKFKINDNVV